MPSTRTRSYLADFALVNPYYSNGSVTVFTVDPVTLTRTSILAPLYNDLTSPTLAANPQALDGDGKWVQPIYVDQPVVMVVGGSSVPSHETGIVQANGRWAGEWAPTLIYFLGDTIRDGAAGTSTGNIYVCTLANTASASFGADVAAGDWSLLIDVAGITAGLGGIGIIGT